MANDDADYPLIFDEQADNNSACRLSLEEAKATPNAFIWTLTIVSSISGILFGYDTGVISSTLVSVGSDLSSRLLSTLDKSLITSSTSLFALIASPAAGVLSDRLGRKHTILLADVLFVAGAMVQAFTGTVPGMIIGRSIIGFAVGTASLVTPLYIAELSPSAFRGMLVTLSILLITAGQVVAYLVGYLLASQRDGWRWMVGFGAVPAVLQFVCLIFLPETPRWFVKVGSTDAARRVLEKVYNNQRSIVDQVLRSIDQELSGEQAAFENVDRSESRRNSYLLVPQISQEWSELFRTGGNRRALTIACLLQSLQQLCGFNCLMYFSATIFALIGFTSPILTSLSIAISNFVFTLVALLAIDRVGRRTIVLWSMPVMILGLSVCSIAYAALNLAKMKHETSVVPISAGHGIWASVILVALVIYVCGYAIGLGNVAWQQSELFSLSVRSVGSALATGTNWGCNFLVGLTFLPMMEAWTPPLTFATYAVVCVVGWICVWYIYPETKNLELEEVKTLLSDGWGVEKSKRQRTCRS